MPWQYNHSADGGIVVYGRWKAYAVSSKFKEGRLVGKGVADWWVLGTRPLGMAPHEPLDDAETMQDGNEYGGKRERRPVAHWPCPGDTPSCLSAAHGFI